MKNNQNFTESLLDWFYKNKRDLIFRETKDPYKIWISEIMAQQTQIDTLLPYFNRFVKRFPDLSSLANSTEEEVLKLWEGLGYYSRAKNLRKTAKIIDELGFFPNSYEELIKLPGIGPYTAGAILSICFNKKVPAVDGNVIRVITRSFGINGDMTKAKNKKEVSNKVLELMPEKAGDFNESLMELGALICTSTNSKCLLCPVRAFCFAYKNNKINEFPEKKAKSKTKKEKYEGLILTVNNKILFLRRKEKLLNNMSAIAHERLEDGGLTKILSSYKLTGEPKFLGKVSHKFTHIEWETSVYHMNISEKEIPKDFSYESHGIPTAFKKMLNLFIDQSSV